MPRVLVALALVLASAAPAAGQAYVPDYSFYAQHPYVSGPVPKGQPEVWPIRPVPGSIPGVDLPSRPRAWRARPAVRRAHFVLRESEVSPWIWAHPEAHRVGRPGVKQVALSHRSGYGGREVIGPEDRAIRAERDASWWRWATPIISTATFLFGLACRSFRSYWREAVPPEPIDPRTKFAGVHPDPYI
jgi:hypothetical protein